VDKYPVDGEGEDRRRSEIIYIEDPKAFEVGLTGSVDPGPFCNGMIFLFHGFEVLYV